jgi:hypothetical protein
VIRRLVWMLLGLVLGVLAVRKLEELAEASRPGAVAERTGRRVGGTRARWRDAVTVGRDAAREREQELRSRYGVPSLLDLAELDGRTGTGPGESPDTPTTDRRASE